MKKTHQFSAALYCITNNMRVWMGDCWLIIDDDFDQSLNECQHKLMMSIILAMHRLIIRGCLNDLEIDLKIDPNCPDLRHYVVKNPIADLGLTVGNMSIEEGRTLSRSVFQETATVVRNIVCSDIHKALKGD